MAQGMPEQSNGDRQCRLKPISEASITHTVTVTPIVVVLLTTIEHIAATSSSHRHG
jgi:hypothetical protein